MLGRPGHQVAQRPAHPRLQLPREPLLARLLREVQRQLLLVLRQLQHQVLVPLLPLAHGPREREDEGVPVLVGQPQQEELGHVPVADLVVVLRAVHPHEVLVQLQRVLAAGREEVAPLLAQLHQHVALHLPDVRPLQHLRLEALGAGALLLRVLPRGHPQPQRGQPLLGRPHALVHDGEHQLHRVVLLVVARQHALRDGLRVDLQQVLLVHREHDAVAFELEVGVVPAPGCDVFFEQLFLFRGEEVLEFFIVLHPEAFHPNHITIFHLKLQIPILTQNSPGGLFDIL
mmetsp:Transcript_22466/g.35295  ORF Transcript_22466/g.35295 Transcript_22466/m.35295 type:complete len:287 (+) Transcript_22466:1747-2607(+)